MKKMRTPVTIKIVILILSLLGSSAPAHFCFAETSVLGQTSSPPPAVSPQVKTTDQMFKNIQVFKGLPASQLDPTMAFISGSLGVRCNFCHVPNAFEKDDKPTKIAARRMIQMVFDLNKGSFNGESAVSCFTCHRGKSRPVSVPAIGENLWAPAPPKKEEPTSPTVDQVLDKYVQAIGGTAAWEKIKSRVTKGSR